LVQQESFESALLITAADAPDRGPVTFQPAGDVLDGLARSDGQDDTGMLNLKEGQVSAASDRLQDRNIGIGEVHGTRAASTHEATSVVSAWA
jgi:hypothetical protein